MNYEQRTAKIFAFLFGSDSGLLRRYTKPAHLTDDRAREEVNDMVRDINAKIPSQTGEATLDLTLDKIREYVRVSQTGRSWPTIKLLVAATAQANAEVAKSISSGGTDDDRLIDMMADWYRRFGNVMPSMNSAARTAKLVQRGVMTAREAQVAGFVLTPKLAEAAKQQPLTKREIDRHVRVSAKLWHVDETSARLRLEREGAIPASAQADAFGGEHV